MKEIDVSGCDLVCAGQTWEHDQMPNAPEMSRFLERQENLCFWFQPSDGTVDDQFPVLSIKNRYYTISLRVQKALFRHCRLRKGFVNREYTPNGKMKLIIPKPLLVDKQRTSNRFLVRL